MAKQLVWAALNSPFGLQLFAVSFLLIFLLAFRPPYVWFNSELDSFQTIKSSETQFIIEQPGFLKNTVGVNTAGLDFEKNEAGELVVKRKRTEVINYKIQPGDNVTRIAHKFGLNVATILWANNLTSRETLQQGTEIRIPPQDGVYYKVQKNETLSEIATAHKVTLEKIAAYNTIPKNIVQVDQEIFLPGATKLYIEAKPDPKPVAVATRTYQAPTRTRATTNGIYTPPTIASAPGIRAWSGRLIKPAQGVLTQGYHSGHYAIDIANSMNTPIYAAADGVVEVAKSGGWHGGYGNYVIIDHGSGVKTLYAHNNIIKVQVGQRVTAGQVVSLMGNTGRVFGRTGIHLHFELRINGRKTNPYNYF